MAVPTAILISGVLSQVEDFVGRTSGLIHSSGKLTGVAQPIRMAVDRFPCLCKRTAAPRVALARDGSACRIGKGGGHSGRDHFAEFRGERTAGRGGQVHREMLRVTGADDRGVAVRMGKRVTQDHFRSTQGHRHDLIEFGARPEVVERRALDFRIGSTLGDATAKNDPRPGGRRLGDQVAMLRRQA